MTNLCGHERDVLILALGDLAHLDNDILVRLAQIPEALPEWRNAVLDLVDPAKLVEMLAARGRELGVERWEFAEWAGKVQCCFRRKLGAKVQEGDTRELGPTQARAVLLQWLQLPGGAREEAERVLRGNHVDPDELLNTIPLHERAESRRFDPDPDRGE